jgi:hypothetical protein
MLAHQLGDELAARPEEQVVFVAVKQEDGEVWYYEATSLDPDDGGPAIIRLGKIASC